MFLSDSSGPLSNLHNRQTLKLLFTIYTVLTVELELIGALTMIWTFFSVEIASSRFPIRIASSKKISFLFAFGLEPASLHMFQEPMLCLIELMA